MMKKTFDEPAFPHPGGAGDCTVQQSYVGMSMLDYFAAASLTAATERASSVREYDLRAMFGERTGIKAEEIIAGLAYRMAEAMLAERTRRSRSSDN